MMSRHVIIHNHLPSRARDEAGRAVSREEEGHNREAAYRKTGISRDMGIVVPRPAMRAAGRRSVEASLRLHAEYMRQLEASGFSREEASRKAFLMVKSGTKPTSEGASQ